MTAAFNLNEQAPPSPDGTYFAYAVNTNDFAVQVVSAGAGVAAQREELSGLAETLIERDGVEAIVFAGTELALVFDENNTGFPNINGARLHLDAIARRAMEAD